MAALRDVVDPRAAELDLEIVASRAGEIVEYDTGDGERLTLSLTELSARYLEAGPDWIRAHVGEGFNGWETWLFLDREQPVIRAGPVYGQPGTALFWQPTATSSGTTRLVERHNTDGETGLAFVVSAHASVMSADPAGGVVARSDGGTYHIGPDGTYRITTGKVLALSEQTALISDCGNDLADCGLVVLDRISGAMAPLSLLPPESAADANAPHTFESVRVQSPGPIPAISPDGRYAPICLPARFFTRFGAVDLTSGEFITLAERTTNDVSFRSDFALWWAPDNQSVIYLNAGGLMMYNFDDGSLTNILPTEGGLDTFAVRP